jgi:CSLREA domain-containing protein
MKNISLFFIRQARDMQMTGLRLALLLAAAVVVIGLAFNAAPAQVAYAAQTINVTTTADNTTNDAFCSLREALAYTNGAPFNTNCGANTGSPYTINVPAGTYTLIGGELQIGANGNVNVTITGAGAASTIIQQGAEGCSGSKTERVINFDPNAYASSPGGVVVTISDVTISNGAAQGFGGGGILGGGPGGDYLTLSNSVISNNCTNGYSGAGIAWSMEGYLTINNSTFSGNAAGNFLGGAIFYGADSPNQLSITNSTFTGNTSAASGQAGGAILIQNNGANAPNVSINGSTFTQNQATNGAGVGGAIAMDGGTLNLGNTAANRFVGNLAGVAASGALGMTSGTANATNNWWGCNSGPGGVGCDKTNSGGGSLTTSPWVTLKTTASPSTINSGQSTTLTASVLQNSNGSSLTTAQAAALIGLPVTWANAVSGSFSGQQTTIQANGMATATFTHNGLGCSSASGEAKIDNVQDADANATASITITCVPAMSVEGNATAIANGDTTPSATDYTDRKSVV